MYETGTILRLREPKSTDDTPFAYDKIEVIGTSPLSHSSLTSSWAGAEAQGVLIKPLTEFGSTLDEPFGRLRELYEVELIPEKVIPVHQGGRRYAPYAFTAPGVAMLSSVLHSEPIVQGAKL